MNSRIIITDPHAGYKTLMALIAQLPEGVPITFGGDLIDRQKDSRKVVEFVKNGGYDCVLGNHEVMMKEELRFRTLDDGTTKMTFNGYGGGIWQYNGGDACLESYKIEEDEELASGEIIKIRPYDVKALKETVEWFETLPYYIEYKNVKDDKGQHLLVTHTTPVNVWDDCDRNSQRFKSHVTWDRIINPEKIEGVFSCYGHTPQKGGALVKEHYACIDTGAYYKHEGYGTLTALQFPEMRVFTQENIE